MPALAAGKLVGSFCLTEPEAGSDAGSLRTTARRDGAGYVINGTKRFITNAPHAGIFTVMARTRPESKGADGITAFLVDANPGITIGTRDKKMGQRGALTADVIFDDSTFRRRRSSAAGMEGAGFQDRDEGPGPRPDSHRRAFASAPPGG